MELNKAAYPHHCYSIDKYIIHKYIYHVIIVEMINYIRAFSEGLCFSLTCTVT